VQQAPRRLARLPRPPSPLPSRRAGAARVRRPANTATAAVKSPQGSFDRLSSTANSPKSKHTAPASCPLLPVSRPPHHKSHKTHHTQLPTPTARISYIIAHHIHHDHPAAAHIHAGRHHCTHTSRRNIVPFLRKHRTAALSALQRPISTPPLAGPRRERRTGVTVKPAPSSVSVEFHARAPG